MAHLPRLGALTRSATVIEDGCVVPPERPGPGIEWDEGAVADPRVG
ncbi:hypothetical protein P3L51_00460 [Streptomyces sp. PSRA5]